MTTQTEKINKEYGVAEVRKKHLLCRRGVAGDKSLSLEMLLTFDGKDELVNVVTRMQSSFSEVDHGYGKLKVGKAFWLTRTMIGLSGVVKGIALAADEAEIDAVIAAIEFGEAKEKAA